MIAKVVLETMQNARKLVSIVEKIPYDAELCCGRYVVNAKSMLGVLSMPGFAVEHVADTNGAGDSFWGGFLYKISQSDQQIDELTQKQLVEYARFGNAVASLCVEKRGAIPAMPKLVQVEERLEDERWK